MDLPSKNFRPKYRYLFMMQKWTLLVFLCFLAFNSGCSKTQSLSEGSSSQIPEEQEGGLQTPDDDDSIEPVEKIVKLGTSLYIGDSLSSNTHFANRMVDFLNHPESHCSAFAFNNENQAQAYARPSAAVRHFAETGSNKDWLCQQSTIYRNGTGPNLTGTQICANTSGEAIFENLNNGHKPDTLIIALGTNSLGFSASYITSETKKMLAQIQPHQKCYWILPTYVSSTYRDRIIKTRQAITAALSDYNNICIPIETYSEMGNQNQCSSFYVSDGIHHTNCGSDLWAQASIEKICALENQ